MRSITGASRGGSFLIWSRRGDICTRCHDRTPPQASSASPGNRAQGVGSWKDGWTRTGVEAPFGGGIHRRRSGQAPRSRRHRDHARAIRPVAGMGAARRPVASAGRALHRGPARLRFHRTGGRGRRDRLARRVRGSHRRQPRPRRAPGLQLLRPNPFRTRRRVHACAQRTACPARWARAGGWRPRPPLPAPSTGWPGSTRPRRSQRRPWRWSSSGWCIQAWVTLHLMRQHGRILLSLDELAGGAPVAAPERPPGLPVWRARPGLRAAFDRRQPRQAFGPSRRRASARARLRRS